MASIRDGNGWHLTMRLILVYACLLIGISASLRKPFWGLLFYLWLSYFRPEYWMWNGFWLRNWNITFIVGAYVALAAPFANTRFRFDTRSALIFLFLALDVISTVQSPYFSYSKPFLLEFIKIIVITYLFTAYATEPPQYRLIILVIALTLGFETSKQGWLDLFRHPGEQNINTINFLGDENEVAIGLFMLVPLLLALAQTATHQWERWLHRFIAVGVFYRAVITYSRGGFLACGAMGIMHVLRSKNKVRSLIGAAIVGGVVYSVLPQGFWDRMSSIQFPQSDSAAMDASSQLRARDERSARSRLHFWTVAKNMAADNPLLGVGQNAYHAAYNRYDFLDGEYGEDRAVHSVWYGVLAEVGYPGFVVFIVIILLTFISTQRTIIRVKKGEIPRELGFYALALQTGCAAFIAGGSFVSWQWNEMLWHFIGLSMALDGAATVAPKPAPSVVRPSMPLKVRFETAQAVRGT